MGGLMDSRQAEPRRETPKQYHTMGATSSTAASASHLDSFFDGSRWTREDVMVVAATIQIVMWLALLYVEVKHA